MYKVLIVEDEPPIVRYIKRLIETECTGFEVIGTADDGADGLNKINALRPDIVLTDVKMPIMDGITLAKRIKTDYPEVYCAIISGYQEFDYVKQAMKEGAIDYLLKPVDPVQLKSLLESMGLELDKMYYSSAVKLLSQLIMNSKADKQMLNRYLNFDFFGAFVVRIGALPSRFQKRNPKYEEELSQTFIIGGMDLKVRLNTEKVWLVSGRDESEMLIVIARNGNIVADMRVICGLFMSLLNVQKNFCTIVHSSKFFKLDCIAEQTSSIYDTLNKYTVIGESQILDNSSSGNDIRDTAITLNDSLKNKLAFLISSRSINGLKNEIAKLFDIWEQEARTQVWVEAVLRDIFKIIEKHTSELSLDKWMCLENRLEEALLYSKDFKSLKCLVWELVEEMIFASASTCTPAKYDSNNILDGVEKYIRNNLSEQLTLQGICEIFEVSQPYLSRAFRKHKNMSFTEYVTDVRIKEAKQIMTEYPDMHLKDVAVIVGYKDPFYFSRIFKSVTGKAPSEFNAG